jgi:cysteinyl-tRNA synthetase
LQFRLHNTLSRQKLPLEPIHAGRVGMYVCGVTVYDYSHVGHARVYVVFDVVQRALRASGLDVKYVRNFTDVDDKIIKRANERGETCEALTDRFIAAFHEDMARLDCQPPDVEPRVTTHMAEIVAMIAQIIDRGHAYVVPGDEGALAGSSDVYFQVSTFPEYGALSGRGRDESEGASERVQHDPRKRDQADFALWKAAKPGEPTWDSPWGKGRPGWHIECSAMACKHLGPHFDLHGGGKDLVFPHHENEIAQSRAANGDRFAHAWMHNGFVTIDSEKMSKSLGNFFTIRDVLARFHPQALRYFLLTAHYAHPLNFSDKALEEATRRVLAVYEKLAAADGLMAQRGWTGLQGAEPAVVTQARAELWTALSDDFATPRALAALSEPIAALAQALTQPKAAESAAVVSHVRALVREASGLLGVFQHEPQQVVDAIVEGARERLFPAGSDLRASIEGLVAEREAARQAKDWPRADELRGKLTAEGVEVRDTKQGPVWRPVLAVAQTAEASA